MKKDQEAKYQHKIDDSCNYHQHYVADTPGLSSHFDLNKTTGVLEVVQPFPELGVYSFIVVVSSQRCLCFCITPSVHCAVFVPV